MTTDEADREVLGTTRSLALRLEPRLSPEDREDLVAEVAVKYLHRWGHDDAPDNLEAWLTRTIRTTAIDMARANDARPQREEAEDVMALLERRLVTLGPSALAIGGADVETLLSRLSSPTGRWSARLPPTDRSGLARIRREGTAQSPCQPAQSYASRCHRRSRSRASQARCSTRGRCGTR